MCTISGSKFNFVALFREPSVQQAPWPQPYRDVVSHIIPRLGLPRQNALDIEDSQLSGMCIISY